MLCKSNLGSMSADVLYCSLKYHFPVNSDTILFQESTSPFHLKEKMLNIK